MFLLVVNGTVAHRSESRHECERLATLAVEKFREDAAASGFWPPDPPWVCVAETSARWELTDTGSEAADLVRVDCEAGVTSLLNTSIRTVEGWEGRKEEA